MAGTVFLTRTEPCSGLPVALVGEFEDLVEEEGQEVEQEESFREILAPMAEVMFQVVALVLEDVEGFVLDLPAGTPPAGDPLHRLLLQAQVGHPTVGIAGGAVLVDDGLFGLALSAISLTHS